MKTVRFPLSGDDKLRLQQLTSFADRVELLFALSGEKSQSDYAWQIEVSPQTLQNWINNRFQRIKASSLRGLLAAHGLGMEELMTGARMSNIGHFWSQSHKVILKQALEEREGMNPAPSAASIPFDLRDLSRSDVECLIFVAAELDRLWPMLRQELLEKLRDDQAQIIGGFTIRQHPRGLPNVKKVTK